MKNIILYLIVSIGLTSGAWAQQSPPLRFSSYQDQMISFYPSTITNNFYGFGLDPGKLRFQVVTNNYSTHSFGFFNGPSEEIATLNSNNASWSMRGDDPDIDLDLNSSSSSSVIQLRFQVDNSTKGELRYDSNADEIALMHGSDKVINIDHNATDYWVTVRRGLRAWKVKTDATLADYVFQPGHRLMPLSEVEQFVWKHHHLPGVISQDEVDEAGGVELTAFTVQLQEKLEELYLHTIEQEKRIAELEKQLAEKYKR